jgi:diguanylate cyclase (GGDEF)-like protein
MPGVTAMLSTNGQLTKELLNRPRDGMLRTLGLHLGAGAVLGYTVLHPASVAIHDATSPGHPPFALGSAVAKAFNREHRHMATYFVAVGAAVGLLNGLNRHRIDILFRNVRRLSITDELTGLYNRRFLLQMLERERLRAERYATDLSLMMIDIDHFKNYNDRYGHPSGDGLLRVFAGRLLQMARKSDVVARYGGEEFTVLMPDTRLNMAVRMAERLRRDIEAYPFKDGHTQPEGRITISIGCSRFEKSRPGRCLIQSADECLYRAKNGGRNQIWYC